MIHTDHFWEQEWKEKEWKAWQSKQPNYAIRDYILGDKEQAQVEAKETAFRDTIERRAQQVPPCWFSCYWCCCRRDLSCLRLLLIATRSHGVWR